MKINIKSKVNNYHRVIEVKILQLIDFSHFLNKNNY